MCGTSLQCNNTPQCITNSNSVNCISENEITNRPSPVSNELNEGENAFTSLKNIRLTYKNGLIIGYLNINSIRNKFLSLKTLISDNIDILVVAETKLDSTFTTAQFLIDGFQNQLDMIEMLMGGGLMIYIRDKVPAKELLDIEIPVSM